MTTARRIGVALAVIAATLVPALPLPPAAGTTAEEYAPLSRPGPALTVPRKLLKESLTCSPDLTTSGRRPVLLVAGTTINGPDEFSWNWVPALNDHGIPWCMTVNDPAQRNMGDVVRRAEFIVYAIRTMYRETGRKIAILGHSQGATVPRWALRFWPDTRAKVNELVGLSPGNHGTRVGNLRCALPCQVVWQQFKIGSNFVTALNSGREMFPGIDYTNIYSNTDEVVVPAQSGALHGNGSVTNIATQDICPLNVADHLATGSYDAVTYALAIDALTHRGPANPGRIARSVCLTPLMPYVDAGQAATITKAVAGIAHAALLTGPLVTSEPPLPSYVYR